MSRVAVVYRRAAGIDAIDQYCRRLVSALAAKGVPVSYHPFGLKELPDDPALDVVLQYNPFRWGRSGFAPRLLTEVRHLRRSSGARITLMVHEAWIDIGGPKSALIGIWQRAQLRALLALADHVLASTESIAHQLGAQSIHVPPGATIEPAGVSPEVARREVGLDDRFVVTLFGRSNPSRALGYAEVAVAALARTHGASSLVVLNLGADSPPIRVPAGLEQLIPGALHERDLSRHLSASDVVLLPFTDGITTRRTTLMAALAHGRPVLSLAGPRTDSILREARDAIALTPLGDRGAFARAAVRLSRNADQRESIGAAGRSLYRSRFDWPVLADGIQAVLSQVGTNRHPKRSRALAR
ncbi:MAG: glycosyltransferase [Solirubrobacteraceae bacterium]